MKHKFKKTQETGQLQVTYDPILDSFFYYVSLSELHTGFLIYAVSLKLILKFLWFLKDTKHAQIQDKVYTYLLQPD